MLHITRLRTTEKSLFAIVAYMPLIYITGIAGAGKSTVRNKLTELGYTAYDVDEPGIGAAHDTQGRIVKVPTAADRSPDWFETHSWRLIDGAIEKLQEQAATDLVFLCGTTTANQNAPAFDQTICLDIDEPTLRKRLAERKDNDFGRSEHELRRILSRHKIVTEKYREQGVPTVDATQAVDEVVEDILKLIRSKKY